jgi:hypothetical protein
MFSGFRMRGWPVLAALFTLNAHALDLAKVGGHVKMADATAYGHAYAPSVIWAEGSWHAYFCSGSGGISTEDWDHVRHVKSADLQNWGEQTDLMQSTTYERANCDPSVVRFDAGDGLYYYMMYSGNVTNVQTVNFLARSASPAGPFLKYTQRGTWEARPADAKIITRPKKDSPEGSNVYGAGQPSLVVHEGKVYMFYTDVTAEKNGIYLTTSTNMKDWTPPQFTGLEWYSSIDVKYDDTAGAFVVFSIDAGHGKDASASMRSSKDGLHWDAPKTICDKACLPDFASNVGVSGDERGHIFGSELLLGYGAPYDLGSVDNWGKWHLWADRYSIETRGQIKGHIDQAGGSPATVDGWACALKVDEPIDVHLYVGGPAGVGAMAGGVKANRDSEPAVAEACKTGGAKYRFSIPLTAEVLAAHAGKKVYVHGLSPVGGANDLIGNSGALTLPGTAGGGSAGPTPPPPAPSGGAAGGVDASPALRFYNPSTGEHFYTTSEQEGLNAGFKPEGVGFKLLAEGQPGTKKLYRCLKSDNMHFMSEDPICENAGKNEGSVGAVFSDPGPGRVPLFRGYNPVLGLHLVTTNAAEFEPNGYTQEGPIGYVKP